MNIHSFLPVQTRNKIKALVLCSIAALSVSPAASASNAWLLGDNGRDAVSIYDMSKGTEVTLIYGMHFLRGMLNESGPTTLKESGPASENRFTFTGTITMDNEKNLVKLTGKMMGGGEEIKTYKNNTIKVHEMNRR